MGVPKFYRWISERYPCLSEVVKEYQVPEFDNLYLDMNGIIHVCSHPNDDDPHFRITEEQIFKDIFHYIEVLFRIVRPRKVFFMAVDGVAPRAKMNQQRGRRFRSAKEAEENIKKALQKGETLPDEKRFDSNCITPGTKFMVRLNEQLKYMVQSKVTSDPAWQGIRIYLSGHETPGEGEHKITEFIRHERMQSDYDPNTRHCLYGLDADLMMLGLCSHEPHFSLLREEVRFTGKKNKNARTPKPEETTFHLLHLSLMREYIDHEFGCLKTMLPFEYNLESVIDDWVLMGFLVGNDFIPHLPHLHISHNALPLLYNTYMQVLPTLDGYLNENGIVNLARFEKYLEVLSQFDTEKFEEHYADFKWLESKTGRRKGKPAAKSKATGSKSGELDSFCSLDGDTSSADGKLEPAETKSIKIVKELSEKQGLYSPDSEAESTGSQDDAFNAEFKMFKRNYYQEKLHFQGTDAEIAKMAYEYVLAIQWICHYYYNGVQSWSWYYPYHYAPFLSDLRSLRKMKLRYDMGKPFLPYQQLLAVLPAASKECLPEPYWDLMCNEHSPIIDYYPKDFTCDLNGKQQEWEAVVLIPFIIEKRLLAAMEPCWKKVTTEERARNVHSGCVLYTYDQNIDYYAKSSLEGTFPNIAHCKASCEVVPLHSWSTTDTGQFVKGILPGCRLSVYYPGFPTLYHLPHKSCLKKQGVKVFQMPSRNENTILTILPPSKNSEEGEAEFQAYSKGESLDDVAKNLLGTSVYVDWPHMEEAKVVALSDGAVKYEVTEHVHSTGSKGSKHKMQRKNLSNEDQQMYFQDVESVKESYLGRRGINIGETDFVIYAQPLLGRKYICGRQGQITLEKQWATKPQAYVLQAIVKDISVKDPTFQHFKGVDELFPIDSTVFMLGHPYYGCQGKILNVQQGMTSVAFETPPEPDIDNVIRQRHKLSSAYYAGWELASRVGVSSYMISRITGTIFVFYPTTRKWQVGLNLRFSKDGMGIAGYTRVNRGEWSYSEAVEVVLRKYMEKFPEVLRYLQDALKKNESEFDAEKMVGKGKDVIARLQEVSTWLKTLDCYGGDRISEHSDILESKVVAAVENKVKEVKDKKSPKPIQITLKPHVLYRPLAHQGTLIPDKAAQHRLLDRVVNVRDGYTVPLGLRGTVIGIHRQPGQDALFDVVFDDEFLGGLQFGGRCSKRRGYRMPECAMVNLSHGKRATGHDHKPTAVVRPQNKYSSRPQQAWAQPVGQSYRAARPGNQRGPGMPSHPDQRSWNRQRPQSAQMSGPSSVAPMQRGGSSQIDRSRPQNQPQKVNMFDALWNTLKDQNNDASINVADANTKTRIAKSNTASVPAKEASRNVGKKSSRNAAPNRESKIRESTSAPTQQQAKQQRKTKNACNYTTLKQAAKSLPKVSIPTKAVETKHESQNTVSSTPSATSVASTVTESVPGQMHVLTDGVPSSTQKSLPESAEISGKNDVDHLNQLFQSIKVSQQQPPPVRPHLAFTQTQAAHNQRFNAHPVPNPGGPNHATHHHQPPRMRFRHPDPATSYPPHHPAFYQPWLRPPPDQPWLRQPYYGQPHQMQHYGPPGPPGPPPSFLRHPGMQMAPTYTHPSAMATHTSAWPPTFQDASSHGVKQKGSSRKGRSEKLHAKEGTQKLCEMLNNEQENEDANSSKWSTGDDNADQLEEDKKIDDDIEKLSGELDINTLKDVASDGDSEKDEEDYLERSTSVEDENTGIIKKQSKVDELIKLCTQCSMLAPIYTYFTTGDEQVVSTVQLWNGIRFSSHPQVSRDKAMEEAAQQAIGYLKSEQRERRPVSTSPPSSLPYFLPVHGVVQSQYYGAPATFAAAPVTYAASHPQTYFVPSMPPHQIPYSVLPHAPLMSVPPEYPQAAMIPAYRYDPMHHLGPYVTRPMIRVQVSPSHQLKGAPMYHHQMAGPKPVVWTGPTYHPESYQIQDHANTNRKTEFQLVDTPPFVPLQVSKQQVKLDSGGSNSPDVPSTTEAEEPTVTPEKSEGHTKKSTPASKPTGQSVNRPNSSAKPKLAISFDKDKSQVA